MVTEPEVDRYENMLKGDLSCHQREAIKRHLFRLRISRFDSRFDMSFEDKVKYSSDLIKKVIDEYNISSCVSCSFGKDSTVLAHLALKVKPDILVAFANTGVEYPETLDFRDLLVKEWDLNYVELKPEKTFWQCVKKYGYPSIRYMGKEAKKKGKVSGVPRCCFHLKEKPMKLFYKAHNIKAVFLGLTADESYQRKWTIIRYTDLYKTKKNCPYEMVKCHPLAYWKEEEIWRYTKKNNLPVSKLYEFADRNGCVPCTSYIGWRKKLAKINPKLYRKIMKDMMGSNLDDFMDATS